MWFLILFLSSMLAHGNYNAQAAVKLPRNVEFVTILAQQFIYELEDYGICNTKLPDMFQNISIVNYFGNDVIGNIYYTNGFLSTFQEVTFAREPVTPKIIIDEINHSVYISVDLIISSLMIFYDYNARLTEINVSGTVAIPKNNLLLELTVKKFYDNNFIDYNVTITGSSPSAIPRKWDYIPSNKYTEIINKNIYLSLMDDEYKNKIEALWKKLFKKAIDKVPFPSICFNC